MKPAQENKHDDPLLDEELRGIPICCYKGCGKKPDWIVDRENSSVKTWHPYACDEHYTVLTNLCRKIGVRYHLRPYTPEEAQRIYRQARPLPLNIITGIVVMTVIVIGLPVAACIFAVKGLLSKLPRKTG